MLTRVRRRASIYSRCAPSLHIRRREQSPTPSIALRPALPSFGGITDCQTYLYKRGLRSKYSGLSGGSSTEVGRCDLMLRYSRPTNFCSWINYMKCDCTPAGGPETFPPGSASFPGRVCTMPAENADPSRRTPALSRQRQPSHLHSRPR